MKDLLVILPLLLPMLGAALCLIGWRSLRFQRGVSLVSTAGLCAAGVALLAASAEGVQTSQAGGWAAPFGITLAADVLSALMVLLAGITGFAGAATSIAEVGAKRQRGGYFALLHVLLLGVCGAFLTGDLFNLYVWFEVMLIASFVLLALGGGRARMEGAIKYVMLNLLSSAVFLAAAGLLYAVAHTLNMADLHGRMATIAAEQPWVARALAGLFLVTFGIKAGLFPLYSWLPASYPSASPALGAVFSGLLTKVGLYAMLRVLAVVFPAVEGLGVLLLTLAVLTMLSGVLGAVAQFEIRRILSFHIISQIGYIAIGLGLLFAPDERVRKLGVAAAVFYIAHHIVVKANLFLIGGIVRVRGGSFELARLGGLAKRAPWLAALFLVPALSLAGVPPLSGFWAKLAVIRAAFEAQSFWVAAAALAAGLLTLISMIKIWNEAFWKEAPEPCESAESPGPWRVVPSVLLAAITLAVGLFPGPLLRLSERAAEQLLDTTSYVQAVAPGGATRITEDRR